MKRFLMRFFRIKDATASKNADHCRSNTDDSLLHEGFKTKPGQGPFLSSFDGRVIPLRKARFLRKH